MREFDGTLLTGGYQNFGAIIGGPPAGMVVYNTTNDNVYVWVDIDSDDIEIPAHDKVEILSYHKHNGREYGSAIFKKWTQLMVKSSGGLIKGGWVIANIFI